MGTARQLPVSILLNLLTRTCPFRRPAGDMSLPALSKFSAPTSGTKPRRLLVQRLHEPKAFFVPRAAYSAPCEAASSAPPKL